MYNVVCSKINNIKLYNVLNVLGLGLSILYVLVIFNYEILDEDNDFLIIIVVYRE